MIDGIFSTLGAKSANEKRLDITTNNIANATTAGYKASRPVFSLTVGDETPEASQLPSSYVTVNDSYVHFSDAPLVETGGKLDLALEGSGFFVVSTSNGTMYTRNGQFTLNSDKQLVTQDGNPVVGDSGAEVTLDGKDINIETDGSIYVDRTFVDKIKVVDFEDKRDIRPSGRSLFVNTNESNSETTPDRFAVRQGYYETSNVDLMKEMIEMMQALRAYESYTKVDQFFGEILDKLIDLGKF
jgi:flagellar basal-body rod protein FlgF